MAGTARLIRYLAVLGPAPENAETLSETASVATQGAPRAATLERFPSEDYEDVPLSPLLSTLPDFCFQEGLQRLDKKPSGPEFQAFVFSDHKGGRRFVACLIVHERTVTSEGQLYTPKALCLVSLYPCLELFRSLLADLVVAARSDRELSVKTGSLEFSERLVARLVSQIFFELPLPPSRHTMVGLTAGLREMTLLEPESLTRDFSFRPLVAFLSCSKLAQLFVLALLERKVVLNSQKLSPVLLVVIMEALRALLFPFDWEHTYLPMLPNSFRWALESPAPFLMGVCGKLAPSELPAEVVVFDLDSGKTIPEKPQVTVPSIIEQPVARLAPTHKWEQRSANQEYWAKYQAVSLSSSRPRTSSADAEASPTSARGRVRHRRSLSSTSCDSENDSDGNRSVSSGLTSGLLSGALGPAWNEEQERSFRQKVAAIFLEALVVLLHKCPEMHEGKEMPHQTLSKDERSEKALLEEFRQTNAWERFMALSSTSPRRQLFDQAIRLYGFWSQEPPESRKPLEHNLRDWVTRLYEPPQLICLSEALPLRCGPLQPHLPVRKLLQRLPRSKRSRFEAFGDLQLSRFEAEIKKQEERSCLGLPRSLALRLPGGLQCRALGKETGSKSLPSDAVKTFAAAMGGALEELPALLRKGEGDECAWLDNPAPKRQESLRPRLPYFLAQLVTAGAEVRPTQPHLELGAACQVNGMREVRSRCSCGWANSLWDAVASSIQGDTRNETGHCCTACSKCSAVLEPLLTLRKRLPRAVIDRSHSELSISTSAIAGDAAQIHLLIVKECLKRIASRNLETSENLLEDDPEVYWCLQVFFGLKAEVFWRSSGPLVSLSVTSFKDMCRNFLAEAKAQEGEPSLPGAVATEDSKEEVAAAALPKEAVQNVETFEQLAKKVSSRRHHSVEPPASFPTEREPSPGILKRGSRRASTARTITLGDIEDAPEEESKEASRPKEPEVPELSFVHVNMEALLEPYPELPAPPVLKQRPRAERRRSGPARPRAFKEERSVRQVGSPSSPFRAPVRVKKPATVVAKHRPLVVLLPGEGYAKRSKAVAFDSPRKGRAGYSSMDEENRLVQEIAQLSRRIEQLRAGNG